MLKSKKAVIYPKSNDEELSQCALIVSSHYETINHSERINNLKLFTDTYNQGKIKFSTKLKDLEKFGNCNLSDALNALFINNNNDNNIHIKQIRIFK